MDVEFVFQAVPFPPPIAGPGCNAVSEVAAFVASMPVDQTSPFVAFAAAFDRNGVLSTSEVEHAKELLKSNRAFAEARRLLAPRFLSDSQFWAAFFCLLSIQLRHEHLAQAEEPLLTRLVLRQPVRGGVASEKQQRSFFERLLDDGPLLDAAATATAAAAPNADSVRVPSAFAVLEKAVGVMTSPSQQPQRSIFAKHDGAVDAESRAEVRAAWRRSLNELSQFTAPKLF